jgi:hypothetical protein
LFTVEDGGVIVSYVAGKYIGWRAGFDETHMPNHLNMVVKDEKLLLGIELSVDLRNKVSFKKEEELNQNG